MIQEMTSERERLNALRGYSILDTPPDGAFDRIPRTLTSPLALGEVGLRFYAAAPLVTHEGDRLGTINIIDFHQRESGAEDEVLLKTLAGLVKDQMELRWAARKTIETLTMVLKEAQNLDQILTVCACRKFLGKFRVLVSLRLITDELFFFWPEREGN